MASPKFQHSSATQYVRLILNVVDITDVTFISAGDAKAVDMGQINRDDFFAKLQSEIRLHVA